MSTKKMPIATPKKGAAVSHTTEREVATGQFTAIQVHKKAAKESSLLVQKITGIRSGNREKMLIRIKNGTAKASGLSTSAAVWRRPRWSS